MLNYLKLQWIRFITLYSYKRRDWKEIEINECGQKLVPVPKELSYPFYFNVMKLSEDNIIYLREEVLEKVLVAREALNRIGLDIMVYDGWRSMQLQENLFWYYMNLFTFKRFMEADFFAGLDKIEDIKRFFGELSSDMQSKIMKANRTYVSWPSKDPLCPSPHATGGAVDVWLFARYGTPLDLGVPFDWMEDDAGAFYHLKLRRKPFSSNDKKVCKNRKELLIAMSNAGFSCYGPEIWHFNFGNQMDALVKRGVAKYSYVEP